MTLIDKVKLSNIREYGWMPLCHQNCPYERECTNHHTAGDFRTEGGDQPILNEVYEYDNTGWTVKVYCEMKTNGQGGALMLTQKLDWTEYYLYDMFGSA